MPRKNSSTQAQTKPVVTALAGVEQRLRNREQQQRKQGDAKCPQRQDAEFDMVARPDSPPARCRCKRRRSATSSSGLLADSQDRAPFVGKLIDVELGQCANRIEERDAQSHAQQRQVAPSSAADRAQFAEVHPTGSGESDRPAASDRSAGWSACRARRRRSSTAAEIHQCVHPLRRRSTSTS